MRQVEQIMGMPISVDIPSGDRAVFKTAFSRLEEIDKRFSTYKPASEASRFARGEIKEEDLHSDLKFVITECRRAEQMTDGYFSAWAGGVFEPSGYVKGWAIAEAGKAIEAQGYKSYCIGAGGDILARSTAEKVWNIGIQNPKNRAKVLNRLSISNGAVATSGNYERGAHIINPKTQKPAEEFWSVTVIGPDIILADILATAIFASGHKAPEFMKKFPNYRSLVV